MFAPDGRGRRDPARGRAGGARPDGPLAATSGWGERARTASPAAASAPPEDGQGPDPERTASLRPRRQEARGRGRALVHRDEDRQHGVAPWVGEPVLMGPESRSARVLVVDLVLERDRRLAERAGGELTERAVDESGDAGVAGRDVL